VSTAASTRPSAAALATLFGSAAALTGLAIYQWLELLEVQAGRMPACAINATFNCAAVWNSPFAQLIHDTFGIPIAGFGVLWGAVALFAAGLLVLKAGTPSHGAFLATVKLWALVGIVSCVGLVAASVQAGAVCLTCLGTYALVIVYAVGAMFLLGPGGLPTAAELAPGIGWALVLAVPVFLALQVPGARTPKKAAPKVPVAKKPTPPAAGGSGLDTIFAEMGQEEKLNTAWARAKWMASPTHDVSMYPVRARKGPENAPVKFVEFTDLLCGHCAQFEKFMEELLAAVPPGLVSVEPRYYPLDGECNPRLKATAGDGLRCTGAKLQICLESHPRFFEIRKELFANQQKLDLGTMMAIATRHGAEPMVINACLASPDTEARLKQDIEYATKYGIQGTPFVLLNGREVALEPGFLFGMILSAGDVNAPAFLKLPPPPPDE
jgi:serine/threonine-protein kinase